MERQWNPHNTQRHIIITVAGGQSQKQFGRGKKGETITLSLETQNDSLTAKVLHKDLLSRQPSQVSGEET